MAGIMVNFFWLTAAALLVDRVVGDPLWLPHPVLWMGKWIHWWEAVLNRPEMRQSSWVRFFGSLLVVMTIVFFAGGTWLVLAILAKYSPYLSLALQLWLISTTIAWRGLAKAGRKVASELCRHNLVAARAAVAEVVGRDTADLSAREVTRAAVETIAENLVDAIVSPVFFAAIGGAPLAIAYRAVNTLDSMVGYKNERFHNFGWASARLDDVLNFVPARITAVLLFMAAHLVKMDARQGWCTYRRDAKKHPSPNSGIPESFVAGALRVQLGGMNTYKGQPSLRPTMGDALHNLECADISRTIRLLHASSIIMICCLIGGGSLLWLL
jgi:adenosylcobinamide-phosphate synthase